MNRCVLIGRVGRDPEVRTFSNGGRSVNFSLATSRRWKDKSSGEVKEQTQWHNVSILSDQVGKIAEAFVRKGSRVAVEGEIQYRDFEKDGHKHTATNIVIAAFGGSLELLSDKKDGTGDASISAPQQSQPLSQVLDDDLPF